ncbi:MAG: trypsin-like peptidase domain-containing protein [Rhodobiaceae bacterium]
MTVAGPGGGVLPRIAMMAVLACALLTNMARADHGPATWSAAAPSVVVIEPTWPGYNRPGFGAPPGTAPAGTGIFIGTGDRSNHLVTAAHVIARATEIEIVTEDGMRHAAAVIAVDNQRDIAILETKLKRRPITLRLTDPAIGEHGCAIGNSFGLGLSISCGVVSAIHRKQIGFNPIEDFVQTDAAINPGGSGGALVDADGWLIGMIDGIFTKEADIDAGVNFAVSVPLLIEGAELLRRSHPQIPALK